MRLVSASLIGTRQGGKPERSPSLNLPFLQGKQKPGSCPVFCFRLPFAVCRWGVRPRLLWGLTPVLFMRENHPHDFFHPPLKFHPPRPLTESSVRRQRFTRTKSRHLGRWSLCRSTPRTGSARCAKRFSLPTAGGGAGDASTSALTGSSTRTCGGGPRPGANLARVFFFQRRCELRIGVFFARCRPTASLPRKLSRSCRAAEFRSRCACRAARACRRRAPSLLARAARGFREAGGCA